MRRIVFAILEYSIDLSRLDAIELDNSKKISEFNSIGGYFGIAPKHEVAYQAFHGTNVPLFIFLVRIERFELPLVVKSTAISSIYSYKI